MYWCLYLDYRLIPMRLRLECGMRTFVINRRSKALICTLGNRLSSAPGILRVVNNGHDIAVAKFHNSPTTYVLFISVSVTELVTVCV